MENKIKERRAVAVTFRASEEGDSRLVEGYASVFDSQSEDLGFREYIHAGAFDGVIEASDVLALLNHDASRGVLARSKYGQGSLSLTIDEKGLHYSFEAPKTALGDELLENLRRGEIDSSSFAFTVKEERWEKVAEGEWVRHIDKVDRLYDVSPVYNPAYAETICSTRGLEEAKAQAEAELRKKEQEERDAVIDAAYNEILRFLK